MADTAVAQANRLVELVAWLSQRDSGKPVSYREAAKHLGVSEAIVRADLDVLVRLSDDYKEWVSSLRVAFVADGFVLSSRGAFQRPFRLTGEEALALLIGLMAVRGGGPVANKLGAALSAGPAAERVESVFAMGPTPSAHVEQVIGLARGARDEHQKLEISYCGLRGEPSRRVVHAHQVVQHRGWWYIVAWCESAVGWRHFRAERVLEARLLENRFEPQETFRPVEGPPDLLHAEDAITAKVAFSPDVARWIKERYPDGREERDGWYVVAFRVADPAWLVREILQYGVEAEVVEPEGLRQAFRKILENAR